MSDEETQDLMYSIYQWAKSLLASYCVDTDKLTIAVEIHDATFKIASVKASVTQTKVIHIRNVRWNGESMDYHVWKFDCPFLL